MHLKINGLKLHLEDGGNSDGFPLIFLHSWAGSARSWKYVVDALPIGCAHYNRSSRLGTIGILFVGF